MTMTNHSGLNPESTRIQRSTGREAGGIRCETLIKSNTLGCNTINVRGCVTVVAITTEAIRPERVDINIKNSHIASSLLLNDFSPITRKHLPASKNTDGVAI